METALVSFIVLLALTIIVTAAIATLRVIREEQQDPYYPLGQHIYRMLHDALLNADQLTISPRQIDAGLSNAGADYAYYLSYDLEEGYLRREGEEVFSPRDYEGARATARAKCFPGDVPYVWLEVELNLPDGEAAQVYYREGVVYLQNCDQVEDLRQPGDEGLHILYFYYANQESGE